MGTIFLFFVGFGVGASSLYFVNGLKARGPLSSVIFKVQTALDVRAKSRG